MEINFSFTKVKIKISSLLGSRVRGNDVWGVVAVHSKI